MPSIASSKPTIWAMTAPIGAPTTVARTQPFESRALTRSQRGFGTRRGKRLRSPLLLSGPVSEETAVMATRSQAGRSPPRDSVATSVSAMATTA
jgi:hypothetical protein